MARPSLLLTGAASSLRALQRESSENAFFSFAYWNVFRMEEMFSSLPPRMEKQFSFAKPIAIYRVGAPLRAAALILNPTTLSDAHPNHPPAPFLSWRLSLCRSAVR